MNTAILDEYMDDAPLPLEATKSKAVYESDVVKAIMKLGKTAKIGIKDVRLINGQPSEIIAEVEFPISQLDVILIEASSILDGVNDDDL